MESNSEISAVDDEEYVFDRMETIGREAYAIRSGRKRQRYAISAIRGSQLHGHRRKRQVDFAADPLAAFFELRSSRLQRSEHVLTCSQSLFHFFRQENGRPHAAQIFVGRSDFRRIFGMAIFLRTSIPFSARTLRQFFQGLVC